MTPEPTAEPTVRHAWDGGERRWDAYFAAVLAGTVGLILVSGPQTGQERLIASVALVAMVPWYVLVGRRVIYGPEGLSRRGLIYLAGLIALLAFAQANAPGKVTFILLALGPQAFTVAPYGVALIAVVLMNLSAVLIALAKGANGAELGTTVWIAVLVTVFSIAFGTWISRIIEQSRERAELIAQLEQTRTELAEANREAGMLAERDRLASEIHDTIAQGFTSIVMLVQAAEAVLGEDPERARKQLAMIGETARENLAEARALVAGLTPTPLAAASLADALARLAERAGQESGMWAEFMTVGVPRPPGTTAEVVLLRVCQEALANVRRHAAASCVSIVLTYSDDAIRLEVTDDGAGFNPDLPTAGYGLRGMRARVRDFGGELTVRSALGAGTTVIAEVP